MLATARPSCLIHTSVSLVVYRRRRSRPRPYCCCNDFSPHNAKTLFRPTAIVGHAGNKIDDVWQQISEKGRPERDEILQVAIGG